MPLERRGRSSSRPPVSASLTAGRRDAPTDPALPMLHRLAVVYLMLPVVVWLVGWFEWWLGLPAAALLAGALRRPLSGPWRLRAPTPAEAAVLAVAALWVLATAAGGVFDPRNFFFYEQRVTLLDLGRHPWPTYLPDPLAAWRPALAEGPPATPPLLRYYLGWHMVPGLAAHWLGPAALNWAVPLWTWAGVALIALLFTRGRRGRALVIALAVLVFFSGMTFAGLPAIESRGWVEELIKNRDWYPFLTYEPAILRSISLTATLKFSPHHLLAAGLYTLLCLHLCRQPRFLAVLGVLLAAAPFWSAFVAVGLLPLLVVVLWKNGVRPLLSWPNLCLAGPLFGLVVLYLTSGAMDMSQGWMWQREGYGGWPRLMRRLLFFFLTEFLLLAVLLEAVRPAVRREPFFIAAVATLLLLPLYWYDGGGDDLLMRGSLPALLVLGWLCAGAVARGWAGGGGGGGGSCAGAGSAAGPRSRGWCWCSAWGRSTRRRIWCGPSEGTACSGMNTPGTPPWWTCPLGFSASGSCTTRRTCSGGCCASPRPSPSAASPTSPSSDRASTCTSTTACSSTSRIDACPRTWRGSSS